MTPRHHIKSSFPNCLANIVFLNFYNADLFITFSLFFQVKKYGKITGFYLGNQPVVVLGDYSLLKEAFKGDALAARPSIPFFEDARPGNFLKSKTLNDGQ